MKTAGRRFCHLLHARQETESLGLHCENGIKLAAKVLQGDDRRQFHELFLAEMPLQSIEETIRDPLFCVRHPFAKF